jgi:RNA polymerase sigma-70 factor, ECF subfamily
MDNESPVEEWIARAQSGDEVAFRQLYDRHVERVHRLAWRMCRDEELARDLTQESFIRAFRSIGDFRGDAAFGSWLHRICVRTVLNGLRSRGRHRNGREPFTPELVGSDSPEPLAFALRERLREAVSALPDIYRSVLLLHDLEGWTHREIAEALEVEVGTSKARLSRARARLRDELGAELREEAG